VQKVVIDTNVFISYLFSDKGFSFKIVDALIIKETAIHFISDNTLKEYFKVFNRERFIKKKPEFLRTAYLLYDAIKNLSVKVEPIESFTIIKDDSDNRFLEVAYSANADFLITGNKLHFTFASFYNTHIVSPREYWKTYKP
jgi:putative PIN family toxin of toxin-antitoxin system